MRKLLVQPQMMERVYTVILDSICDGRLPPGVRLAQENIAEQLNVSRQPVGQALMLLKSQGFVCKSGRRGLMVSPLEEDFVHSLYEFRGALDRLAARTAAGRATAQDVARGKRILAQGQKAIAAGSVSKLIGTDMEFHRLIYELSGNTIIADTMNLYLNHLRRVMSAVLRIEGYGTNVWTEHDAILDAIAEGDAEKAETLARKHVDAASEKLQRVLREQHGHVTYISASTIHVK
ncbi:MAG: GntR family transcriptional regulator [Alphaproteobacteria bacterium]|nr:GntR family transcriptional regulator [Alphaproteobacteria bacterium]